MVNTTSMSHNASRETNELLMIQPFNTKLLEEDGSSVIFWRVFSPNVSFDEIYSIFDEPEGRNIAGYSDCSGRAFAGPISIKRTKTRVLVQQQWGLDI